MALAADIPVNPAGIHIPFTPIARLPQQDRMGGGSFATRMDSFRPASNPEEASDPRRPQDPAMMTPREPRAADALAMQMRIEIAKLREEDVSRSRRRSRPEDGGAERTGRDSTSILDNRLSSLLGTPYGRSSLHFEA